MQSIRSLTPKEMPEKVMKAKFIYKVKIVEVKKLSQHLYLSFSTALSLYLSLPPCVSFCMFLSLSIYPSISSSLFSDIHNSCILKEDDRWRFTA